MIREVDLVLFPDKVIDDCEHDEESHNNYQEKLG